MGSGHRRLKNIVTVRKYFPLVLTSSLIAVLFSSIPALYAAQTMGYEVWVLDQSDTSAEGGGTLYVYEGSDFTYRGYKGTPEVIDLADSAKGVGDGVGKRPHMIFFNAEHTHALISNVASGHVYIMDASTKEILSSIRMGKDGDEMRGAHAAIVSPDNSVIAVTNHKKVERISSDFTSNEYNYNRDDALDLAKMEDEAHPDNWIVCPIFTPDSKFVFATLRGGGLFVIDVKSTPMKIVQSFSNTEVGPNGCGGITNKDGSNMYINSGGGTPKHPTGSDIYVFDLSGLSDDPPSVPEPEHILSREGFVDSHGMLLTKNGKYLWTSDRAANLIEVIDVATNKVVNQIDLKKESNDFDAAPDLIFPSPSKRFAFATLRGPAPLTGNAPDVNNAVGNSPGLAVFSSHLNGKVGKFLYDIPLSHIVEGAEKADPHGIAVREIK